MRGVCFLLHWAFVSSAVFAAGAAPRLESRAIDWSRGKRCETTLLLQGGSLFMPPRSRWYAAGLAVRTADGRTALGLRDYLGSHREMEPFIPFELSRHLGLSPLFEVRELIYGGELLFENRSFNADWGKLTQINHTSSYVFDRFRALERENNAGEWVVTKLVDFYPNLVSSEGVNVLPYHPENEHLIGSMPGNIRHDFYALALKFKELARDRQPLPPILGVDGNTPMPLALFLKRFLWLGQYLEDHPLKVGTGYAAVAPLVARWQRHEAFNDEEWYRLETGIDAIVWDSKQIAGHVLVLPLS